LAKRFDGLRTDPARKPRPVFVTVQVKWTGRRSDVIYGTNVVCTNVPIGYIPIAGRWLARAREQTIGNRDNVTIDDVTIFTTNLVRQYRLGIAARVGGPARCPIVIEIADLGMERLRSNSMARMSIRAR
jgi:hypothetical protein